MSNRGEPPAPAPPGVGKRRGQPHSEIVGPEHPAFHHPHDESKQTTSTPHLPPYGKI